MLSPSSPKVACRQLPSRSPASALACSNWRWLSGGDAFRVVYAVQLGADVWVIHAFQKKSKTGIKTPKHEIDLIHARPRRLEEIVQ
jgi:hypothetical protein